MGNLLKVLTCTDLAQEPNFFLDFESKIFLHTHRTLFLYLQCICKQSSVLKGTSQCFALKEESVSHVCCWYVWAQYLPLDAPVVYISSLRLDTILTSLSLGNSLWSAHIWCHLFCLGKRIISEQGRWMNQSEEYWERWESGKQKFPGFYYPCPQNISTLAVFASVFSRLAVLLERHRGRYRVGFRLLPHESGCPLWEQFLNICATVT